MFKVYSLQWRILVVFVVSHWGSRIHFSTEVTWFCQDQVLLQIFQMRQGKKNAHGNSTIKKISLKVWLCLLSSLADIFNKLKELSVQCRPVMLISFTTSYKTLAIKKPNLRSEFNMENKVNLILMKLSEREMEVGIETHGML